MNLTQSELISILCSAVGACLMLFLEWPRFRTRWLESGPSILRFVGVCLALWFIGFGVLQLYAARHVVQPYFHYLYRAVGTILVLLYLGWHSQYVASVASPGTSRHKRGLRGGYVLAFIALMFIWDGTFYYLNRP
jgi:putative effector of murein hydrolase LrgA (UPF0299 family)